ncbi:MAG: NADP-reducing hydrogenase subunit HndC [Nitrospirae bacterium]|nr:MAG: formate dehydrogenase subunit beta [Nitrospira sp. OLB3]MBV6469057.1 NADP-reducing hydrogenase subunit HndC [Nitrospirota bacterium]MCE7965973.1 formate dehydrogenase [Nitrospira sp. NTP2]MCK6493261.1 SLBB domain-containing protein [Nitrospira sp.]MEB2338440.1 SLBB domain-containing protein [Nitrospirales bacterium]
MATRLYLSNDTSARAAGAAALADAWAERPDLQLIRTSSRGAFFLEPMVERDSAAGRIAWFNVTQDDLPRILAGTGGTPVEAIPFLARQTRIAFAEFGETEPLALDEYQARGGLQGLQQALHMGPDAIIEELKQSRLRGRGGAAFPVWNKWLVARQAEADEKYVVANADEGDAGTYCDRMILEGNPFRLLEGMLICARAIGASRGYVYCRQEYPAAAATLRAAILKADEAELLELDGEPFPIEVVEGAGSYVCGEETALLESLEGKRGVVRARPPYPAQAGLYGRPTIVSNVLTFAILPSILARGGSWYASLGTGRSSGTMVLQLGGRVKQPGLVEVPFGMSLRQVLDQFGGGMAPGARFKAVQVGGPLGSLFPSSKLDLPICYDAFAQAGAVLGHGGIVVYDHETDMVDLARHFMAFTAYESCGKCTPCRIGSVRGREILERIQSGGGSLDDLALLHDLGETMKVASLCALGGRAPYPVLTAIEHFPSEFRSKLNA